MNVLELEMELTEGQIWGRRGTKVVRKYRCSSGKRAGKIVSNISQCFAPINIKKRITLKKTKARLGDKMVRKSLRTKRTNPASIRVRSLNKQSSRKGKRL